MTKADIVNEIARTTGIDKAAVLSAVEQFMTVVEEHNIPAFKLANSFKEEVAK